MRLRLLSTTLTPFLLAALSARGQIIHGSTKALAAVPRPDNPLPTVACEGALKDDYSLYLAEWPEKAYDAVEYAERCSHFSYARQYVNAKAAVADPSFDVALNQFADYTPKELALLGGALPVATSPKLRPSLFAKPAATATFAATEAASDAGASSTDGLQTPAARRKQRRERRMERRRAARRRELGEEEPVVSGDEPGMGSGDAVLTVADAGAVEETIAVAEKDGTEPLVEEGMQEEEEDPTTVAVAEEEAAAGPAAPWDISALVSEEAEAAAAEAPALDIEALRVAGDDEAAFVALGVGDDSVTVVDRHGVNSPATIAAVTRLAAPLPEAVDYSTADNPYGVEAVLDARDTGKCGASWALVAAGLAESRLALEDSDLGFDAPLSAQELLDCADPAMGCGGGRVEGALTYMSNNGVGVEGAGNAWLEGAATGVCRLNPEDERAYLGVIAQVSPCNQRDLMRALVYLGPVAAHVKSSCRAFLYYDGGILDDEECFAMPFATASACASAVDHPVLLVGYDSDPDTGVDYWLVKGNYGPEWGEDGYARIKMATRGLCGNGCLAAFPLTVVPRTFGISADGTPAFDGSAPAFFDAYAAEAEAEEVPEVDPTNVLRPADPLPNQRHAPTPVAPPAKEEEEPPAATATGPVPVTAPEDTAAAAEKEAHKRRSRMVGGALGGAFAGVFLCVCAFVAITTVQRRRQAEMDASAVPERPHLDVL